MSAKCNLIPFYTRATGLYKHSNPTSCAFRSSSPGRIILSSFTLCGGLACPHSSRDCSIAHGYPVPHFVISKQRAARAPSFGIGSFAAKQRVLFLRAAQLRSSCVFCQAMSMHSFDGGYYGSPVLACVARGLVRPKMSRKGEGRVGSNM